MYCVKQTWMFLCKRNTAFFYKFKCFKGNGGNRYTIKKRDNGTIYMEAKMCCVSHDFLYEVFIYRFIGLQIYPSETSIE